MGSESVTNHINLEDRNVKNIYNMIENLPGGIGIFLLGKDGNFKREYLNSGFYRMVKAENDISSRLNYEPVIMVKDVQRDKLKEYLKGIYVTAESFSVYLQILMGDGGYLDARLDGNVSDEFDENEMRTVYVTFTDITESLKNEQEVMRTKEVLNYAFEESELLFWEYNLEKDIMYLGEKAQRVLGMPRIVQGMPQAFFNEGILFPEYQNDYQNMIDTLKNGQDTASIQIEVKDKTSGAHLWQDVHMTKIYDENKKYITTICISNDITQQKNDLNKYEKMLMQSSIEDKQTVMSARIDLDNDSVLFVNSPKADYRARSMKISGTQMLDKAYEFFKRYNLDENVFGIFNREKLIDMYKNGKTHIQRIYRMKKEKCGCWYKTVIELKKNPVSDNIEAYISTADIHKSHIRHSARKKLIDNGVVFVSVVNVVTGESEIVEKGKDSKIYFTEHTYNYSEDVKKDILKIIYPDDQEICMKYFSIEYAKERLSKEQSFTFSYRMQQEEKNLWRQMKVFYADFACEEIIYACSDINETMQKEQKQKQTLIEALQMAERANAAKSEFLSRMSHDIRTPMNAIMGFTNLAVDEINNKSVIEEYLENIRVSGRFLLGLINDILDVSKIESGEFVLHPEEFHLEEFLESIDSIIVPMMNKRHQNFKEKMMCGHTAIYIDKLRFNQIFFNLLSNASKFTPDGGEIEFGAELVSGDNHKAVVKFTVRDSGIGMSPEFLKKLYDPFSQEAEKHVREIEGSGLGLSIVKALVEKMDGTITVKSEKGKGTEFAVTLPLPLVNKPSMKQNAEKQNAGEFIGKNILIIEDHPMNVKITQKLLEKKGMKSVHAENGQIGYDMFIKSGVNEFDAILMDIRMPVMDGIQSTLLIRSADRSDAKTVPIIAMTADAFTEDMKKTQDAGMNDYLVKPVDPEKLYSSLLKWIG